MSLTLTKPTLFITMGLPASGKTYFTQRLAADLDIFFLNGDSLRMAMIDNPTFKPEEHALVYRTFTHIAKEHLEQGQSIICNANYHIRNRRREIEKMAKRLGVAYYIIWVQAPYEIVKERIQVRDHEIPADKMVHAPLDLLERMKRNFEPPQADEPVIVIDGTKPYKEQRKQFLDQITAGTK